MLVKTHWLDSAVEEINAAKTVGEVKAVLVRAEQRGRDDRWEFAEATGFNSGVSAAADLCREYIGESEIGRQFVQKVRSLARTPK